MEWRKDIWAVVAGKEEVISQTPAFMYQLQEDNNFQKRDGLDFSEQKV